MALCPMCRKEVPDNCPFCPECGYLFDRSIPEGPKNLKPYLDNELFKEGCDLARRGVPYAFEKFADFVKESDSTTVFAAYNDIMDASLNYILEETDEDDLDDLDSIAELSERIDAKIDSEDAFVLGLSYRLAKHEACDPYIALTLFHAAEHISDRNAARIRSPMRLMMYLQNVQTSIECFEDELSYDETCIWDYESYMRFCEDIVTRIQEANARGSADDDLARLYAETKRAWMAERRATFLTPGNMKRDFEEAAERYVQCLLRNDDRRRADAWRQLPIRYIRPNALTIEAIQ